MKDFAIFNYSVIKKNQGGPSGYLYNLLEGMKEISVDIPFITAVTPTEVNNELSVNRSKKNHNPFIEELISVIYHIKKGLQFKKRVGSDVFNYGVIHVHSCEDVYYLHKYMKYKGEIILTSHRPEPLADEKAVALKLKLATKWNFPILRMQMKRIENYAYKHSSAYIFPSEGAMKIYNDFPGFKKFSKEKPVGFVFTGTQLKLPTISVAEYRGNLNVTVDDKVICYIGRHNYIKGYDLLSILVNRFEQDEIKVVCAGANNTLPSPINKNWIELGYITDPNNLINASDIVVIPNRNTYFDLIIVEILSLGKIVITSDTGGNIDISKYTKGIRLFKNGDSESLYKTITETFELPENEKEEMKNENLLFYETYCTVAKFADNYLNTMETVCTHLGK